MCNMLPKTDLFNNYLIDHYNNIEDCLYNLQWKYIGDYVLEHGLYIVQLGEGPLTATLS